METCFLCEKPAVGYAQGFLWRNKVESLPVCGEHMAKAKILELIQRPIRDFLGKHLAFRKGTIPRVKVSFKPGSDATGHTGDGILHSERHPPRSNTFRHAQDPVCVSPPSEASASNL